MPVACLFVRCGQKLHCEHILRRSGRDNAAVSSLNRDRALATRAWTSHTAQAAPIIEAPNIVTPLLPHGYKRAQEIKVSPSRYNAIFTLAFIIDESTNSNTYFLFSTAQSKRKDAPVILWLNGGRELPVCLASLMSPGHLGSTRMMKMVPREVSRNRDAHLLALDNPSASGIRSPTHGLAYDQPDDRRRRPLWCLINSFSSSPTSEQCLLRDGRVVRRQVHPCRRLHHPPAQ